MKIIQVVPSLEERHGGPSKSVYELSAGLASAGSDVELLATGPGKAESHRDGSLTVQIFERGRPATFCPSAGLKAHLGKADADVVHHHALWLRTLHYSRAAARRLGKPLVVSPRGMMSRWAWNHHGLRKKLARTLVHPLAFRAVRGWHATSESEAADIRERGFKQPICVAPNGVAAPAPEALAAAAAHWHRVLPATAERPVALFYARFHPKKRLIELIDLWLEHGPRAWLLLVAGIPEQYSVPMLEDYLVNSRGVGGVAVADSVGSPPPYAVASLFLLPSYNENFGLSVAEALACGVPALVTDSTPWAGLNANGGWCVPWSDYGRSLRSAIGEGRERLAERGRKSRDWVLREYSWERSSRALLEFYRQL